MRFARRTVLLWILACFCGCQHCHPIWDNVCRTVHREPKCFDYCDRTGQFREIAASHLARNVPRNASPHFRDGYLDGFADYLHRGGSGNPPPMPPRRYWEPTLNMCRQHAVEQWREGFRVGAESAVASGMRQQLVIPSEGISLQDNLSMLSGRVE